MLNTKNHKNQGLKHFSFDPPYDQRQSALG